MKVAIIGSRNIYTDIKLDFTPTEIISGGAKGVDLCAKKYAIAHNIKMTELLPDYKINGRGAPFVRNRAIVERCDLLIAYWDGKSKGTEYTINYAKKLGKKVEIRKIQ